MSVFDDYSFTQSFADFPFPSSNGSWGPDSRRRFFRPPGSVTSINGGTWNAVKTNSGDIGPSIRYIYGTAIFGSANFENIQTIAMFGTGDVSTLSLILNNGTDTESHICTVTSALGGFLATWDLPSQFSITKNAIKYIEFKIADSSSFSYNVTILSLFSSLVCITRDTEILLVDGNTKMVQDLVRGDIVAGDPNRSVCHRVTRIPKQILSANSPVDIVTFEPNSLGDNIPSKKLTTTMGHSLLYQEARRPAFCFVNYPGVTRYERTHKANDLMIVEPDGSYILYDIQFDHIGSFVANGVVLQSRLPWSLLTPLPKELYFDQTLYQSQTGDDNDPGYSHPLNYSILEYKKD